MVELKGTKDFDVIIIGGGAAGMMAAYEAADNGRSVILLEKNKILGKKLLITGKGRCNITNDCEDVDVLIKNCIRNGRFMYSSFSEFNNKDIIKFFEDQNLKLKTERGDRVFPVSDSAGDVTETMENAIRKKSVKINTDSQVKQILQNDGSVIGVELTNGKKIYSNNIILATGGMSYPDTGSNGDGYEFARKLGHTIINLAAALVPIETVENWPTEAMGLSLKNAGIKFINEKEKVIYKDFGEMLFTHFGLSGPVILSGSSHLKKDGIEKVRIEIDLKPALDFDKLDKRIQRDFEKYANKQYKNSLDDLLPNKLIEIIIRLSEIDPDKRVNQISREERERLVNLLKALPLTVKKTRPLKEAIVTRGGVSTKEINPKTMESKLVKGLFFAGEIIDVDAYTGGFNLTIAFSTGVLAGRNVCKY